MCYSQTKFSYSEQSTTPTIRATGGLIRWIWSTATFLCFSSAYAQIDFAQLVKAPNSHNTQALQAEIAGYAGQSAQSTMLLPNGQHPTMRELSPTRTVVFLSRSMPETVLIQLLKQGAGRKDVVFAFRGWGDGPVTDMFKYSKTLLGKLPAQARKKPPQIIVMPAAFREYRIHYVPAVLHRDNDNKWYLLQGAQSLDAAVGTIRARRFNERVSRQYRVSEPDQAVVMEQKMKRQDIRPHIQAAQQSARKLLEGTVTLPANTEYRRYNYAPFVASTSDIVNPRDGKVLYPKGTRFNVLALDPQGKRAMAVIDGRSRWQVEFARHLVAKKPDTLVLYTKLGYLANAGIAASPLDAAMKTVGDDALCSPIPAPFPAKSEFKAAMLFPYPENGSGAGSDSVSGRISAQLSGAVADFFNIGSKGAHRLGASDFSWAKGRNDQSTNSNDTDAVYLLWRWVDCCEFN